MNGEQRTEGERRAAEEFADAVRDQAARFFDVMMEEMRRNPRAYGLGSQPLSQEDAEALAIQTVREDRREQQDDRKPDAPAPDREDIENWVRMCDERRKEEGYRLR
jgi:mevalonate pyrophosphate decarboxylase